MEKVWLVQRLRKPFEDGSANPFAFGAIGMYGGLTEVLKLVSKIFLFDYMGSAEFEWGAVPKALERIWNDNTKKAFEITVKTKEGKTGTVYVICGEVITNDVAEWIKRKAYDNYDKLCRTKEGVLLQDAINNFGKEDENLFGVCGWLELDNGFFFFTNKEMFENTKKLFGMG